MAKLIREAVQALPTPENRAQEVTALTKRLKDMEKRIGKVQEAIETGSGAVGYLVERLEALLVERVTVEQELRKVEAEVEAAKVNRPNVEEVCHHLSRLLEIYETATDEQKTTILQGLVGVVEMHSKSEETCEILLYPEVPSDLADSAYPREDRLEICSVLGAGLDLFPTNPKALDVPIMAYAGGQLRRRKPRS